MNQTPRLFHQVQQLYEAIQLAKQAGQTVGLVPTMGALHAGHLSLVEQSASSCDLTVVTIFVNPTQFAPGEDFEKYPRTLENDLKLLSAFANVWVLAPEVDQLYPIDSTTMVQPPQVANTLEGEKRPTHFAGVATIVLKLFQIVPADRAFFGQKDFQQVRVIQEMVRDLIIPIEIVVCPIIREADGLAMSSRNKYLSPQQRKTATCLNQMLIFAAEQIKNGESNVSSLQQTCCQMLINSGVSAVDYVQFADPKTLKPVQTFSGKIVILLAVYVGQTRLIDNRIVQADFSA